MGKELSDAKVVKDGSNENKDLGKELSDANVEADTVDSVFDNFEISVWIFTKAVSGT